METTVRATCPQCQVVLRIPSKWVGQAVKCKKCGAMVRVKGKDEGSSPDDTLPNTPLPAGTAPEVNAFNFDAPSQEDNEFFGFPAPAPAAPQVVPVVPIPISPATPAAVPALDANGFPIPSTYPAPTYPLPGYPAPGPVPVPGTPAATGYPVAPGYPYAPQPGYPYPMPPGYAPPGFPATTPGYPAPGAPGASAPLGAPGTPVTPGAAPGAPYSFPAPPGHPAPMPGYGPPAGYAIPPGYAPPPGYAYPQPGAAPAPVLPAAPAPAGTAPIPAAPVAMPTAPASPIQPTKPGAKPIAKPVAQAAAPTAKAPTATKPAPAPAAPSNEFQMDSTDGAFAPTRSRRYRRKSGAGKFVWIGFALLLTGGLVAAGVYGSKFIGAALGKKEEPIEPKGGEGQGDPKGGLTPGTKTASAAYPRRLLYISASKYMYLNPLTASNFGIDLAKPASQRIAFDWRIPQDKDNNQVFLLSDTVTGSDARLPMKNVLQGTYTEFCATSRPQDRVVIYFGGHAIEKDGKAYIAPLEAEIEGEDWEKTLIPLDHFYGELQKCQAAQKVVIWDVCRFNPDKGRQRPGSEPMSEALFKALSSPPAGVQAVVSCQVGENANEYNFEDPVAKIRITGSFLLESMKFVAEPRNNRLPKTTPKPEDPLPIAEWVPAIAKRATELTGIVKDSGSGVGKQTITLHGAAPANLPAPNYDEKAAARFEFPQAPKGAPVADIKAVEREFTIPPLRSGLGGVALGDVYFPADALKSYESDAVSLDDIMKDKEKYRFRAAVLESFEKIREFWSTGAGTTKTIRESLQGPFDDKKKAEVKKEQEDWAIGIINLELLHDNLKEVGKLREGEPKRWQAHYDLALACVKSRLAYMNEYNKVLGLIITETLPALDAKLGQDGYILVPSETLRSGKDVKKMAEEAAELFQEITVQYKGTPWAIQAKQEKTVQIGLTWKPATLSEKK